MKKQRLVAPVAAAVLMVVSFAVPVTAFASDQPATDEVSVTADNTELTQGITPEPSAVAEPIPTPDPTEVVKRQEVAKVAETLVLDLTPAVDTEKPVVTLVAAPVILNSNNVTLTIQASDDTELSKIVGNVRNAANVLVKPSQAVVSGTSGTLVVDLVGLGNGTYNLRYNALDAAGNMSATKSFDFTVDNTPPTVTVKPESIGTSGLYKNVSFKLYDAGKIDKVVLNGVLKDLGNNTYSDLNGVKPGTFGAVEGLNTLEVFDVAGNSTVVTFTLDTTGPTLTVKPEGTTGADGIYQVVSYKLFDNAKVVKATLNGVEKPLTPNQWSDLNGIKPGTFGAVEGLNTLILEDALGNQSTYTFTLDTIKPVIITPAVVWVSGTHTWVITQDEANPAKAYVEIQQMVNSKWKKFAGVWIYNSNDLSATFDTIGLTSGVQSQIKISSWDMAGNQSGASFVTMIDNTVPTITIKPESIGSDGVYSNASFKLYDSLSGVDRVTVNGVVKDLTDNMWSDLNNLKPGHFGAVEGTNTIVVQDVAGNTASLTITIDVTAPVVVDEVHEWQTKDGGRDSITLTFSEPVTHLPQGWYGSGTTWNKVFYNTKASTLTFVDQAGNVGTDTVTPNAAPIVVVPPADTEDPTGSPEPVTPSESATPTDPDTAQPSTDVATPSTESTQVTAFAADENTMTASNSKKSTQTALASTGSNSVGIGGISALLILLGAFVRRIRFR